MGVSGEEMVNEKKVAYEKPLFEETAGLVFPRQILEAFNGKGRFCVQCSGCHGCR
jgi:hypothetical protein